MRLILQGSVRWCFAAEVGQRSVLDTIGAHFSGVNPFHRHVGQIALSSKSILLRAEAEMEIPLSDIVQVYHGFDEVYPVTLSRNFGLTWSPLRISLNDGTRLYLLIDHFMGVNANAAWYQALRSLLT